MRHLATGHDCGGIELSDKSDVCVSVIRCVSIFLVKVADLVRSLRVQSPQKKAVAAKKRRQACRRPPPVCISRQLNSQLKKILPNPPKHQRGADAGNWWHGCMESPLKGHDCGSQSYCFFCGDEVHPKSWTQRKGCILCKKR